MNKHPKHKNFSVLFEAIQQAKYNALKSVNAELVNLYWQVGAFISKQLTYSKWGEKTVQKLSAFLIKQDPTLKGFDTKSMYRMVQFYETYPVDSTLFKKLKGIDNEEDIIVATVWRQFDYVSSTTLWEQLIEYSIRDTILVKVNWSIHKILMARTETEEERMFYLHMCIKEKYSIRELDRQISSGLFERTLLGDSQLSQSIRNVHPNIKNNFKDRYVFEFLNLPEPHNETDLQKGLTQQMKNFILELGRDFIFIGEEYNVKVGNSDFYIDLLFYHRVLQCLVAFELKTDKFKPEHLGQLNFYLEALDRDVKKKNENPSIGILLCKDNDVEVVEYALSRSLSPTMVSKYRTQLPNKNILKQKLHELFDNDTL